MEQNRIQFLDGLRGLAITAVVLFHGYVAFPDHLPFGDRFEALPIRLGWQGVELFFLISGFVILMTLEKSRSFLHFAMKRWLRLFPAMLIASFVTFFFLSAVGQPRPLLDLLPGLTFINPSLLHSITRLSIDSLDGSYWSLYVEVVFYAVFGSAFFLFGEMPAIGTVFALFLLTGLLSRIVQADEGLVYRLVAAAEWIGFINFGWFASGALFYLFYRTRRERLFVGAIIVGAMAGAISKGLLPEKIGLFVVVGLFAFSLRNHTIQRVLTCKPLLVIGFLSYPLYLIHSAMLTVLSNKIAASFPWLPDVLVPLVPIAFLMMGAFCIAKYWEPIFRYKRAVATA